MPTPQSRRPGKNWPILSNPLFQAAWRRKAIFIACAVATLAGVGFELVFPLLTARAVDIATRQAAPNEFIAAITTWASSPIAGVVVLLIAVALGRYASQFTRRFFAGKLSLRVQHDVRMQLLSTLQRLDGPRQDEIRTGQVVSRSISDLTTVQGLLAMLPLAVGSAIKLGLILAIMFWLSWQMTLAALIVTPLLMVVGQWSKKALFATNWAAQQQAADVATQVEQTVSGVRVVKGFGQEEREIAYMDEQARRLYAMNLRSAREKAKFLPLLQELPNVALVANIAIGGWLAMQGHITIGVFLAFATYLAQITSVSRMLSNMAVTIQMSQPAIDRVFDLVNAAPETPSHGQQPHDIDSSDDQPHDGQLATTQPRTATPVGIELNDVTMTLGEPGTKTSSDVVKNLSLTVAPGETLALVGPPGSGKSMLIQLLAGFYRPSGGTIRYFTNNGTVASSDDTQRYDVAHLRDTVCCVFDEAFLYSRSVRDNIALGSPDATDADVIQAAKDACAHEFITHLADGYDTITGERGFTLSGGQRQRIALARALLAGRQVLLLDDATSAIDATTEATIMANLRRRTDNVTVVTVAHRHSTLGFADRIALLDDGVLQELGDQQHLRINSPQFSQLMALKDVENCGAIPFDAGDEPLVDDIWPHLEDPKAPNAAASIQVADKRDHATSAASASLGTGLGGRGPAPGGGVLAGMAATEEVYELVQALPEAHEEPPFSGEPYMADEGIFSLRALLKPVRLLFVGVVLTLMVTVLADVLFPTLIRSAIDGGVTGGNPWALVAATALGLVVVVVSLVAGYLNTVITAKAGERVLYGLRVRSFAHVQRLGMDYFERTQSGRIMTRMTADIDSLSRFLEAGLAQAVVSATTLVGVLIMLFFTESQLALISTAAVPIVVVATIIFRRISSRLYLLARRQISAVNADFQEIIAGLRTAQMHGSESVDRDRFATLAERYYRLRMSAQTAVAIYFPGLNAVSEIAQAVIIGVGASMVLSGHLSAGILVAFVLYMALLFSPIQQLSMVFDQYQQAEVSLNRIDDLLNTPSSVPDRGRGTQCSTPFALSRVSFGYHEDKPVLHDVDLELTPGATIAVVGPTGAGKSTVIKLLARYYDPLSGAVTADGVDIRDLTLRTWRSQLAMVPQEAHLFEGTIASNIAYGYPDASATEIIDAIRRVGALTAIAHIPGGVTATVGESGRGLSAGQRQLIALARAELMDPELMLLDEATATLDPATEETILAASDRVISRRTSVVVAHRLATARRADIIVVVDGGRIVEQGTHDELIASNGKYASMWQDSGSGTSAI